MSIPPWQRASPATFHPVSSFAERLTLTWHGHWATSIQKVRSPTLMLRQNETLRRLGRGDFRELSRAMVRDPALLIWLDGPRNRKGRPNENLARELIETFERTVAVMQTAAGLTRVARAPIHGPGLRYLAPVTVEGPACFNLLAVWAQNFSAGIRRKRFQADGDRRRRSASAPARPAPAAPRQAAYRRSSAAG